jgi:drug/metabolite transporter (DMT)-like permease
LQSNNRPFLTRPLTVFLLALACCILWGSSFPAIKNGYAAFGIEAGDIPSKLVFAGWRFTMAGVLLLAYAALSGRQFVNFERSTWRQLFILGLIQTTLQYIFFYIGVANTTGVKSSIMNSTGTFFSVIAAHYIYQNDRLTYRKGLGCALGFAGVLVVNLRSDGFGTADFTLLGEGFVVVAAMVLALGSIYGKRISQGLDAIVMTGWQLVFGGAVLLASGYLLGGKIEQFTTTSSLLLAYLVILSSLAISIWSLLLKYNRVSIITSFNFLVPVFGALLSALFLDEKVLEWRNAAALLLVCIGILLVTYTRSVQVRSRPPAGTTARR